MTVKSRAFPLICGSFITFLFWNLILHNHVFCVKIFSEIYSKIYNKEVQICVKYGSFITFLFWNLILHNHVFCVKIFSEIYSKIYNKEVQICVKYKHHRLQM